MFKLLKDETGTIKEYLFILITVSMLITGGLGTLLWFLFK